MNDPHTVRLWDNSNTGTPLASVPFSSGIYTENTFAYESIADTLLSAGTTYAVSAYYPTNRDKYLAFGSNSNVATVASVLNPGNRRFAFGNVFPSTLTTSNAIPIGPTFQFELATPVPEPSTFAVFALGGIGIVAGGTRRRRKQNA